MFWIIAGSILLIVVTLLVRPLIHKRVQESGFSARYARGDVKLALFLVIALPTFVVTLYDYLGAQDEWRMAKVLHNPETTVIQRQQMLEDWVEKQPKNTQALYLLSNHYLLTGELVKGASVLRKLYRITGPQAQVSAQLAQVLFLSQQQVIDDEIRKLYKESLALDSDNNTALGLQGIDAFEQKKYALAVQAWQRALGFETDVQVRRSLMEGVVKAKKAMGHKTREVVVHVDIAQELKFLPADTRVIVFAKENGSQSAPVMAVPLHLGELPKQVVLNEMTMMSHDPRHLSEINTLDVVARIAVKGDIKSVAYQALATGVTFDSDHVVKLRIEPKT